MHDHIDADMGAFLYGCGGTDPCKVKVKSSQRSAF